MKFDRAELDQLYRYYLALTGQREDAQDLLHSSLESFFRSAPATIQHPLAYIRRIARNRFFDQLRRRGVVQFEPLDDPDVQPGLERDLENLLVDEITVTQIWHTLNPAEREVVFLWAVEGMSANEIALHLGQPRGTVLELTLLGARYCTLQGTIATQLMFHTRDNKIVTFYQAAYNPQRFGPLPNINRQQHPLLLIRHGVEIQLWVEQGLVVVQARTISSALTG